MADVPAVDVIGVGAVNLDYIVSAPDRTASTVDPAVLDRFDYGSEKGLSATEAEELLTQLIPLDPVFSPGGSALNTIASIAAMNTGLSVGYVGLCGRSTADGFAFPDWFRALGIDTKHLRVTDGLAGTCISLTEAGQRSLLTTPGTNANIMSYLGEVADRLVRYLATARVVHVTSFANLDNIHPLVSVIKRLRAVAPHVTVCCDPGAMWTLEPVPDGVPELFSLCDWLLVNEQEFERSSHLEPAPGGTVLIKRPDRIEMIAAGGDRASAEVHHNPRVLPDDQIVDDTGTGDAFAAGLLLALASPDVEVPEGIQVGMRLAAEKLRWPGLGGLDRYEAVAKITDR